MKILICPLLCLIALGCSNDEADNGFIYASFTGNGEDGLHLLASYYGYDWKEVNDYKSVYLQEDGLVRDPSIVKGGDGMYHMIHTTEWFDHRIGLSHSEDLINWTPTEFLYVWADYKGLGTEESDGTDWPGDNLTKPVERDSLVKNCWAPEMFYDDSTKEYVIFWATTIEHPSIYPETWNPAIWENMNHRMYYTVTKDFKTYSPRKVFYAPRNNMVIDAYVTRIDDDTYAMAIKEETEQQIHVVLSQKPLESWVNLPEDFWQDISETEPFAGPKVPGVETQAEGATILPDGDNWLIYCDYWNIQGNGVFRTSDFKSFENISDQLKLPRWIRHGTILPVPKSEVDRLLAYKSEEPGITVDPKPQSWWRGGKDLYPPAICMGCPEEDDDTSSAKQKTVPPEVMEEIYQEIKTPYKYGVVFQEPDSIKIIDSPTIYRAGESWFMTYIVYEAPTMNESAQGYETWLAKSDDLLNWEIIGRIMSFTENTWDANQKAGYLSLVDIEWGGSYEVEKFHNKYWMSYLGGASAGYEQGTLGVGLANSPTISSAIEWERHPKPILLPTDDDARFFEKKTIYKSLIIRDKKQLTGFPYIMYYNAKGAQEEWVESIGMAVSENMLNWKRFGGDEPLVTRGKGICGDAQIAKIDDIYVMFYFGAHYRKGAFERFACSYDLVNWTDWQGEDLIAPSEDYDLTYAHKPWVIKWDGIVYHFYTAVGSEGRVIALATSEPI